MLNITGIINQKSSTKEMFNSLESLLDSFGFSFFYSEETTSTMEEVVEMQMQGRNYLHLTAHQTKGKVGLDPSAIAGGVSTKTPWGNEKDKDLAFTVFKSLTEVLPPYYAVSLGVMLFKKLRKELSLPLQFKWPNDIYLEGKKLMGILVKLDSSSAVHPYGRMRVGIGMNVNSMPKEFASLRMSLQREFPISTLVEWIFPIILSAVSEPSLPTLSAAEDYLSGATIRCQQGTDTLTGKYLGFDEIGLHLNVNGAVQILSNVYQITII